MRKTILIMLLGLSVLLVACGGGETDTGASGSIVGDAARGEELYKQSVIGAASAPGCSTCHSLEPDMVIVGPSHNGIATKAETVVAGKTAEEYLEESIRNPDAHVTEGFAAGLMYQNYDTDLTDQEIADLVAYLLTLK